MRRSVVSIVTAVRKCRVQGQMGMAPIAEALAGALAGANPIKGTCARPTPPDARLRPTPTSLKLRRPL